MKKAHAAWLACALSACATEHVQLVTKPVADPTGCVWQVAKPAGTVAESALTELSGLAKSRREPSVLWAHNDSGNPPDLYAVSTGGKALGTYRLVGATNTDWEDIAVGNCSPALPGDATPDSCIYVADIGDNSESRADVHVLVLAEPATPSAAKGKLVEVPQSAWKSTAFHYPEGAQNAEALAILPDTRAIVLTKRSDGVARLYRVTPAVGGWSSGGAAKVELLGALGISVGSTTSGADLRATGADLSVAGDRLIVRTYGSLQLFVGADRLLQAKPIIATWSGLALPSPAETQGEAVAFDADGSIWTASEGNSPKLFHTVCTGP